MGVSTLTPLSDDEVHDETSGVEFINVQISANTVAETLY